MSFGESLFLRSLQLIPKTLDWRSHSSSRRRHLRISPVCVSCSRLPFSTEKIGSGGVSAAGDIRQILKEFDPTIPLPENLTPPSSWYSDPLFLALELERVFFRGWQFVGYIEQIKSLNDSHWKLNQTDWGMWNLWSVGMQVENYVLFTMYVATTHQSLLLGVVGKVLL